MRNFRKVVKDILYVSKITRVGNKKLLVISVALLAQLTAVSDIAIIAIFASIIADQFTNIELINKLILSGSDDSVSDMRLHKPSKKAPVSIDKFSCKISPIT